MLKLFFVIIFCGLSFKLRLQISESIRFTYLLIFLFFLHLIFTISIIIVVHIRLLNGTVKLFLLGVQLCISFIDSVDRLAYWAIEFKLKILFVAPRTLILLRYYLVHFFRYYIYLIDIYLLKSLHIKIIVLLINFIQFNNIYFT